jgi:hypothetical protein
MTRPQHPLRMSLEEALDEERREVLEILEGYSPQRSNPSSDRHTSPAPVIKSMLDISADPPYPRRYGSIAEIGVGVTQLSGQGFLMGDIGNSQSASISMSIRSSTTSPTAAKEAIHERKRSDRRSLDSATEVPAASRQTLERPAADFSADYQIRLMPNLSLTKRKKSPAKNLVPNQSSITLGTSSDIATWAGFMGKKVTGQQSANLGLSRKSKSPSGQSKAPASSASPNPSKYVTESGKVIDMDYAYKHLSNAALSKSGGSLAALPGIEPRHGYAENKESSAEDVDMCLREDDYEDGEFGSGFATSEEEADDTSSGDDGFSPRPSFEQRRGRKKLPRSMSLIGQSDDKEKREVDQPRRPQSLLAAAEEER